MTHKPKILYIEWDDHYSTSETWQHVDDIKGEKVLSCSKCRTVGFLLCEDKKWIRLSLNWSDNNSASNVMNILKRCITKRRVMK